MHPLAGCTVYWAPTVVGCVPIGVVEQRQAGGGAARAICSTGVHCLTPPRPPGASLRSTSAPAAVVGTPTCARRDLLSRVVVARLTNNSGSHLLVESAHNKLPRPICWRKHELLETKGRLCLQFAGEL